MKNKSKLHYNGIDYPIAVNFNVIEQIQEEFGSFNQWSDLLICEEPNAKALKFGLWAMINEGIDILREQGESIEPVTLPQVGRIVTEIGFSKIRSTMMTSVREAVGDDEEVKN